MASDTSLLDLPDELVIKILDHLDMPTVVRSISCTCQRLHQLSKAENLWRKFSAQYWLDHGREHSSESWRENFLAWQKKWGKYIGCYARVKGLWNRIEEALAERSPNTQSYLKGPVEESTIETIDSMMETAGLDERLPPEVACSFLIHNGQDVAPGMGSLHGKLEVYDHHSMEVAVPLGFNVKNAFPKNGFLVLSWCPYSNYGQAVCLTAKPGLPFDCVYYLNEVERRRKHHGYFVVTSSFIDWLEKLANRLKDLHLIVESAKITRFYQEPTCVAVTRDVKVTVAVAFVPGLSQIWQKKLRTLFAYRISMTMDENAPNDRACKLLSRHWEITDTKGEYHEVNGEAVIGMYPVIKPGTKFSYCSWTPFESEGGFMEGHFTFVNLKSGENYDIICPRFNMKCPDISLALEEEDEGSDEEFYEDDEEDDFA